HPTLIDRSRLQNAGSQPDLVYSKQRVSMASRKSSRHKLGLVPTEPPPAPPPLRRTGTGLSDVGRKRSTNEDAFVLDARLGLYVVADGMGGHGAGEGAGQEAVETVYGMIKRGIAELRELVDPVADEDARAACRLMESAVQAATYMVFGMAEMDRGKSGMG